MQEEILIRDKKYKLCKNENGDKYLIYFNDKINKQIILKFNVPTKNISNEIIKKLSQNYIDRVVPF